MRFILILALLALPVGANAQGLNPEELKAKIDAQTAQTDPFQSMLNDPDPARSLAAVQLMLDSGEPRLMSMAVDFGLQSAVPEVRRAAVMGFLQTQPVLQMKLTVPEADIAEFDKHFQRATNGSVLPDGTAIYSVNFGPFNADKNCYPSVSSSWCAVEVGPSGLAITNIAGNGSKAISNLLFTPEGSLSGSTKVEDFPGGIPTTLAITE